MTENPLSIFDRDVLRARRDRVAAQSTEDRARGGFLFTEIADRLAERLLDVDRTFAFALELGCRFGEASTAVHQADPKKVQHWCHADLSPAMSKHSSKAGLGPALAADEEMLPFRDGCFDLVLSNATLHWVNDLPGTLIQINRALKPDGLFQAALLGGETLTQLRQCLLSAEAEISGGASPRVSPVADLRDAGALMQRAGFALPVIDMDTITVTYETAFSLLADLRAMGETNTVQERAKGMSPRRLFLRAAALYQEQFGTADGRIPATFQVIYLHGWCPHKTQPKSMRPGSADRRLAEALESQEVSAGDKTPIQVE